MRQLTRILIKIIEIIKKGAKHILKLKKKFRKNLRENKIRTCEFRKSAASVNKHALARIRCIKHQKYLTLPIPYRHLPRHHQSMTSWGGGRNTTGKQAPAMTSHQCSRLSLHWGGPIGMIGTRHEISQDTLSPNQRNYESKRDSFLKIGDQERFQIKYLTRVSSNFRVFERTQWHCVLWQSHSPVWWK